MRQEATNLALPPRPIPLLLRSELLFGNILAQLGWFFLGFGGIFFWAFALNSEVISHFQFRGELDSARGVVLEVKDTGASEGGGKNRRGTPIYAHEYSFTARDGTEYHGVSYALGQRLEPGQEVMVEYRRGKPAVSRIQGMRHAMFDTWAGFVVIFPVIGLIFVIVTLRSGLRMTDLLARGRAGQGTLKSKKPTNIRVNNQPLYKLTFELQTGDGRTCLVTCRSTRPEVLEDEPQEQLLYDPDQPTRALLLDQLPGSVKTDLSGQFAVGGAVGLLALIVPAITVLGHGAYAYFRFLR